MSRVNILVVDDEANIRNMLQMSLELEDFDVDTADSGGEALGRLARRQPDLMLLDVRLPDMDGIEVLETLRERQLTVPVIVMSGHGSIDVAVRAIQLGALDFLEKPLALDRVRVAIGNALTRARLERENRELREQFAADLELVGNSPPMHELRATIAKIAPTDGRVLILGESGTGKELVARAIHRLSKRAAGPLVVVNCAAVPGELIESELFGHEKGAFTGALSRRRGRFEVAHRGTLVLDEIGDMPVEMQPKLLRVLEDGIVERIGGSERLEVDVRVLAATNQDLEQRIREGGFRVDLYHRLAVVPLHLVPLRQRPDDIPLLTRHFLELVCKRHGRPQLTLHADAMAAMAAYRWPGNVRELRNVVERLVILAEQSEVSAAHVRALLPEGGPSAAPDEAVLDLREAVRGFERRHIQRVVDRAGGVMTEAARLLGIERSYLYRKMRDLQIERDGSS